MEESLNKLVDVLFVDATPSPENLVLKLRSDDDVRSALNAFYSVLRRGLDVVDGEILRFESWNISQIQAISSFSNAIAFATRSLPVEQAEGILVAILQRSIEFAVCYLEKSEFDGEDLGIQNNMIHLLETALVDAMDMVADMSRPTSASALVDILPVVDAYCGNFVDDYTKCHLEGFRCSKEEKTVDWLLKTLDSEFVPCDRQGFGFNALTYCQDLNKFVFLSQHWAVVHGQCTPRLVSLCNKLIKIKYAFNEKAVSQSFQTRLSFTLRMLKLLTVLTKDVPYVEYDGSLVREVASYADVLSSLFRIQFEFVNKDATIEGSSESIVLMVVEEFLHNVQVIFGNSSVTQNIQACIIASILGSLESSVWRYDKSSPNLNPPLAYFPGFIEKALKLINDLRRQRHWVLLERKDFDAEFFGSSTGSHNDSPSCLFHLESVPLGKSYTSDELLELIFPSSSQWIDNLMQLALFLYSEGLKLMPKMERSYSSSAKVTGASDIEHVICHDDEALFGDLFSETGCSVACTDGYEQPPAVAAAVISISSYHNMLFQAATELLNFLKTCIFSPEWHPSLYVDGCNTLSSRHIDILLYILNCQGCCSEDKSCTPHEDSKIGHIHELCYDLFYNLLMNRALPDLLEDYLVEKILIVESGAFCYDDKTLSLLAHTLFCRVGSSGSQLRTKIFRGYVSFVVEKVKSVCAKCPSFKDLVWTLPSLFHIEVVLIAFHLSDEAEKAMMINLIFSTFKEVANLAMDLYNTQLTCWALVVSRLILVLRHLIFHQQTCPTSLLLDVRSKLRKEPQSESSLSNMVNDHLSSWPSTALKNVMGALVGEEVITCLTEQLIDFSGFSASLGRDGLTIDGLTSKWKDIYSTVSLVLGLWRGKRASAVVDLIVERYLFTLCWDIPCAGSGEHPITSWSWDHPFDLCDMLHFSYFSHSVLGHQQVLGKFTTCPDIVLSLLQHLNAMSMHDVIEEFGWDFLRSEMWLSLVLSITNIGMLKYCMDNGISGQGLNWTDNHFEDQKYVELAGNMVSSMIDSGQFPLLVRLFSSLLTKYVQIHQKAFLATISCRHKQASGFSPLLLLKHTRIDKFLQDELLERSGCNAGVLESCLTLLSRFDAAIDKKASGIVSRTSWECMFHGFPFHLSTSSAVMFSCIVSIRGLIYALDGLLKINEAGGNADMDVEVLREILNAVMNVKFDRILESIHVKCDTIYHSLNAGLEWSDYANLILIKQMEEFIRDINAGGVSDGSIREWIICQVMEIVSSHRNDPSKSVILNFYLGVESVPVQINKLLKLHHSDCLFLIDSLDTCYSESVNLKVLGFFLDLVSGELFPDLKKKIQRKFLDKDIHCLAQWLEKRILGSIMDSSSELNCANGSSSSLRETTINFALCLVSSSSEKQSKELQLHMFESAMLSLDTAFLLFDIHVARSYFSFIVQISRGESLMKQLLTRTVMLMEKLVGNDNLLPGLKFLFIFIETVLSDCGSGIISSRRITKKCSSGNVPGVVGHVAVQPVGSRKNTETCTLSANQVGSASLECDTTSLDEDDATSDGEVVSIDKDDEDANNDRDLASKVCTFTSSGSNFMEQHWYFCYTCDLTVSKGCCSVCAKVCHRGHRVVYSRSSQFFCDCGAGGVRGSNCQCLKPRKFTGSSTAPVHGTNIFQQYLPFSEDGDQLPDTDSDFEEDISSDVDNSVRLSIPKEFQDGILLLLEELDIENRVLHLCTSLMPSIITRRASHHNNDKKIILGEDKVISHGVDLLQLKKAYKSGSIDLKIKVDYSNAKELKSHLASGNLVKSLLSVSIRGRLAVGEGDKVAIFDVGQLIGQATIAPVTTDKTNVKPLSKNGVRFEIVQLAFNPVVDNYLVVAGYEDCQVLTLNPPGEVIDRLVIDLALQGAYIRRVDWLPGSQVQLMVVTNRFVKIYDLSLDNISPIHYFTLPDGMIVDATLYPASQGKLFLVILSENGNIFSLELSVNGNFGAIPLKEVIQLQGKEIHAKGSSLYFSSTYKLLFMSFQDGTTLIGQLSSDAASLVEFSSVYEAQESKLWPAGLHHWRELLVGSGLFICLSSVKSNSPLAVSMGEHEMFAQSMWHPVGPTSPIVGVTVYKALSKDKIHCLVLHDDGSLQIYSHVPVGVGASLSTASEKVKKLGSSILNNAITNPEFPIDFFEKTICITSDVKLGGDAIRNGNSEGAKQRLLNEDGFLESPTPTGFKVSVINSNPDIVMVGFRVHVGNTSASHIPSSITTFQRVIKLIEGMRSWYDIPFTVAESLLADEEFTIIVGPAFNGSSLPRVDSLEIYGRIKYEFGWKEKIDAVLDMEAGVLDSNSSHTGSGKKHRSVQSASIQEQVIADGLQLITKFYSSCRQFVCSSLEEARMDLGRLKCKQLLEAIFESDKEPVLQASACHVLQTVFSKREIYHQVKDMMRLLGVVKSSSLLLARLGIGGTVGSWIIDEFTGHMRAACKIALQRRSNFAMFLETDGSEVVDLLMQVLWGILDFGQPDTQTLNSIVMSAVELIYCYAECLASHGKDAGVRSVAPAVELLKKLLFSSNEAVQTASSLAISSILLQVPFPKQTMLATDDAVEGLVSIPAPADTGVGNNQVMVEEDATTSAVQYSCDGCYTVPILRRRWHCNICPDFDLCEACYEVLDVDGLPPPHSRDHPMTAIPIEVDSVENGIEFYSISEYVSDPNLSVPDDSTTKNSSPSIHVLETNDSERFSASLADPVSISASKQAINSLLLSGLLEQLKGWMDTTTGVRAIPVMQLFYRVSSAVGGPFIDSSKPDSLDLEKLIKWFLDVINLNRPFLARIRSSFGEVAIVVFMFFTLMLRNWHQPGGDVSMPTQSGTTCTLDKNDIQFPPSTSATAKTLVDDLEKKDFASQLIQACDSLREQSFVNYLMDILQQLVPVFKSPVNNESMHSLNTGTGCGALLTVRRDLPAGKFLPFFSDSYAMVHGTDIFIDYHRLLLENAFRLVYTLVRPEKHDRTGEKERIYKMSYGRDLKLDGYEDALCSYIINPHTNFVRSYARRLFLHLCGSKSHYYSVRDNWQFSVEVKRLYKHISKSGGFQNPIPYERSVKIMKCLSTMVEVAAARPWNWQKYCLRHGDILSFLMNGVYYFGEESVIQTLKLLNLAFYTGKDNSHTSQKTESADVNSNKSSTTPQESKKKKKGENGSESGSEKSYLDMEAVVDVFTDKSGVAFKQFIDCFLLEWNSSTVRAEAKLVLCGVWHHAKPAFKDTMLMSLFEKVKFLPLYGQNIVEYTELVTWLLGKSPDTGSKHQIYELMDRCLTPSVIKCIFETLHSQNELLANHPNSCIYNTLSGIVEFDGYYLESEPCVACSSPEVPYSRMKLESLKSETKFTGNRIIVKCTGSYTIQTVTMNVHDARKSKSVKVLNLYYNNRPVVDLSELKNNWSLWKCAKSCHLALNQTEVKVEFPIPITACNFMIELNSLYENLQELSLEPLQCPRCSRPVTDKHGICSRCHENAYQCRQCRNINYEHLDSFLCNECGYSKYGRFEFNFMAKPSFTFDNMENDEDMKRGLAAIESESENAHKRYQQLLGFKRPLLKIVSSIDESEMDSQQKDPVQQMMVSLPGSSCKINRKIALLGVLYGEKCKAAFDSVSKSVQTLQGLRKVLMNYLHQKHSDNGVASRFVVSRSPKNCYGCATMFVTQCLKLLHVLARHPNSKKQLVSAGILSELFENNIHLGPKASRFQARAVLCSLSEGDVNAVTELNSLLQKKVMYCLEHHRSMDIAVTTCEEMLLLSEVSSLADEFWESRLRIVFQLLFSSIKLGAKHPAISEHVILPCLRIVSQVCTPPKPDTPDKEEGLGKPSVQTKDESNPNVYGSLTSAVVVTKSYSDPSERNWNAAPKTRDIQLLSYSEWERGASYLDFVRRQYKVSQAVKGAGQRSRGQRHDYLTLKYALRWKRHTSKSAKSDLSSVFELGSWVKELLLSASSQSIRSEMCMLLSLLCAQSSSRKYRLLNLLVSLLPATLSVGESAAEYFEILFKVTDSEDARLFLTVRGCLRKISTLITQEASKVESLERSLHIDISQGFILHKLIELLSKFLEVPNIRSRFMQDDLLSEVLEALIVIRGLIVQKTKLISDCSRLLKDLLDSLLLESSENKRQFIKACINGLQIHGEERKGRACLFILEQLCNLICPSKPEPAYLLVLNKANTQEEFIRGSMAKSPYSSSEIGPLMRDVKNKICHQLDLLGLLEDDYGMELLVAGNIISLDLSIVQVYELVWKKSNPSSNNVTNSNLLSPNTVASSTDFPPMTVTYRLQGLDGEATEPMIKELEEDREESQDPEVEFAIAGAVRECVGLEILLGMIQRLRDNFKSNQEQSVAVLNLLMYCCKIRENRQALLKLGALGLLLETARRAFSVDAMEPAEGILLIVETLTLEANESDNISITQSALTVTSEEAGTGEQDKKIVLMFLERLSHPLSLKKSNKQQRNTEMVARILPYLTYGEPAAMDALVQHFSPYLHDWGAFDRLQKQHLDNPNDESIAQQAAKHRFTLENFVMVSESLKTSSFGERLKDIILEKGITETAIRHLKDNFANAEQADFKTSAEWGLGLKLPSIPLILSMLRGLSMGHQLTQGCIDEEGILPLLHALERVWGANEIAERAENLLDMLSNKGGNGDGFLEEKVRKLRHATRDEMRRQALQKRQELLQGLGMRQELSSDGGKRIVVTQLVFEGLEDVQEEEDGLACMVCREGYNLRPGDLLGVYSYSKLVNLGVGASGSARGDCVYTTVSYFNIIHFLCHQEAKRADAALKNPKKEWEGATLRNNESLCNSLFPVKGPSVPLAQYSRYVEQYWDNLSALGRADGSRLRLLTYDIVLMLARFATGASFSVDSRGGGQESNSRFLPFMIQMAHHLLDQGSPSQRRVMARAVSAYITSSTSDVRPSTPSSTQPTLGTEETVQYMMVNSLLSDSYESWLQHRRAFLQRGIYHAHMQQTHARSPAQPLSTSDTSQKVESGSTSHQSDTSETGQSNELLSIIRPMLVYTGLIEQLQHFFKVRKSTSVASVKAEGGSSMTEREDESGTLEGWEVVMKERLLNAKQLLGFSKEMMSWLDEMNSASDLQEAFDIAGLLPEVFSGGFSQCQEFVHAAINAGKS
ncbi:PREDICTED: auxin transport protein BIG-like isoform X1 [Lupinus angustifolius]|uniref:auxin transport protein BIG-like isoform X1 n=1 Tax=Lupinus angustifolius TaxID=3871 RepID=UPI00092EE2AE|nr:PREDICTED: auxin transport protein BIG-like isoform X1 [Lupinus angustifolius]XP_019442750.1 PREDICTED: auxin transport protein BIG-like isoform X1 [Lupinus angustifolius]